MQKITLPQGIIVVDDSTDVKEGDYGLSKLKEVVLIGKKYNFNLYTKIIASSFFISKDIPMFVVEDEVEKMAKLHAKKVWGVYQDDIHPDVMITDTLGEISQKDFIAGYKAAQEKGVYSEEDIRNAIKLTLEDAKKSVIWSDTYHNHLSDNIIESLNQESIEFEMEELARALGKAVDHDGFDKEHIGYIIKTTTDSEGQKWCYLK